EVLVEPPQARQAARGGTEGTADVFGEVREDVSGLGFRDRAPAAFQPAGVAGEIGAVGLQRVAGEPPLHPEGVDEYVDQAAGAVLPVRVTGHTDPPGPQAWVSDPALMRSRMRAALPRRPRM